MTTGSYKIVAIIPARMASTRFPGKPLAPILGLPMIEHVRRRVAMNEVLNEVIVATCDQEISEVVTKAGGKAVMTASTHERCTDRIAEAAAALDAQIVINIQGDEPLVLPNLIDELVHPMLEDDSLEAANLVTTIVDERDFTDPNVPKAVVNQMGDLLYISREPIPSRKKAGTDNYLKLKQLGIIAFRSEFLQAFTKLKATPLEQIESVDMMRAIEHGYRVRAVETTARLIAVDVPEDVKRVEDALSADALVEQYLSIDGPSAALGNQK